MLKLFLLSSLILTAVYYAGTRGGPHPLPLWPDSMVIGGSVGTLLTLIAWRFKMDRKAYRHLGNLRRTIWK